MMGEPTPRLDQAQRPLKRASEAQNRSHVYMARTPDAGRWVNQFSRQAQLSLLISG